MRISAVMMASRTRGTVSRAQRCGKRRHGFGVTGKRAGRSPSAFGVGTVERRP